MVLLVDAVLGRAATQHLERLLTLRLRCEAIILELPHWHGMLRTRERTTRLIEEVPMTVETSLKASEAVRTRGTYCNLDGRLAADSLQIAQKGICDSIYNRGRSGAQMQ
jgi:hypothetical protein